MESLAQIIFNVSITNMHTFWGITRVVSLVEAIAAISTAASADASAVSRPPGAFMRTASYYYMHAYL